MYQQGVKVAIGHTIASPTQIQQAVKAGASLSTHLGNGAPLQLPRNNNFIIRQLVEERLAASIIADGFHLPNSFIQLAMKAKRDRLILVSDSTQLAGMSPGNLSYTYRGEGRIDRGRKATHGGYS